MPSKVVKTPRIAEYKSHFECQVEWTKEWFGTRLMVVGRAAGYPCSVRLKALVPLWLVWAIKRLALWAPSAKATADDQPGNDRPATEGKEMPTQKRLYGRTKPGTLLKHHIPIKKLIAFGVNALDLFIARFAKDSAKGLVD